MSTIQLIIGIALITLGLFVIAVSVIGTFRFKYVLNRMHAAALCDTLGLLCTLLGVIVLWGLSWPALKVALIIAFMLLASPVMSHLIARAEILTHAHIQDECEVHEDADHI